MNDTVFVQKITADGGKETVSCYNASTVEEQIYRGGIKVQKRDFETKKAEPQGSAMLEKAAFTITSLNEKPVLVDGNVTVKEDKGVAEVELTNHEDIEAKSQTVKLTEIPPEPEKPVETPSAPKTGDTTNLWIPIAVLSIAFIGSVAVIIRIRRKKFYITVCKSGFCWQAFCGIGVKLDK